MLDAEQVKLITCQIAELSTATDKQEENELLKFHGWLRDFKPSPYLKDLRRRIGRLQGQLSRLAKKTKADEWDAMVKSIKIAPEWYSHEALTEY